MDEMYRAKLTAEPPGQHRAPTPEPGHHSNDIHIQPHPFPSSGPNHTPAHAPPGPVPVHLPNIFVNPYPPQPPSDPQPDAAPINTPTRPHSGHKTIKIGPWKITKPHPLLWLCLGLSVLALVLEVPKGSLPTLTGRHRTLRSREKILNDRLHLLTQLSVFLPPPLSQLIAPPSSHGGIVNTSDEQLRLPPGLRFWNAHAGHATVGYGGDDGNRWWSVEDLSESASVVRSKGEGEEREVWVLRMGDNESEDKALLHALTHSLLLRNRLLDEITRLKSTPCPTCTPSTALIEYPNTPPHSGRESKNGNNEDTPLREEWENIDKMKRRGREREKEIEERERDVNRREQWVVEEMRKLSDKVHAQATELTLEDKITERLKAYQRQLAQVHDHPEL